MAHAVWGALAAQLGGNNAASGAAGAFSGELAARYIIDNYYGGCTDNLSEQERQQISMLATIASGIAGGLVGNSTSAAGMGAMAGKNAVENNLLGGSEDAQAAWIRQHGIDMATCAENPSGAACQKAMNE
ncbi:VENN motif pre-toxin domain-containing protein, partial [Escherichia coli]|uniref:VENN motif pre-toxin domain-containing protein n=1 Tax=Escherichia coli TaxID=562 RepID=UPI00383BD55A